MFKSRKHIVHQWDIHATVILNYGSWVIITSSRFVWINIVLAIAMRFSQMSCLLHCSPLPHNITVTNLSFLSLLAKCFMNKPTTTITLPLLLTSLTYVHCACFTYSSVLATTFHPLLAHHRLCYVNASYVYNLTFLCSCNICCSIKISWYCLPWLPFIY